MHRSILFYGDLWTWKNAMSDKTNEMYRIHLFFIPEYCESNHVCGTKPFLINVLLKLNLRIFYISFHLLTQFAR